MQKNDHLKIAIIVAASLLGGAVITVGIQHCLPSQDAPSHQAATTDTDQQESAAEASTTQAEPNTAEAAAPPGSTGFQPGPPNSNGIPKPVESPYPVANALAVLNGNTSGQAVPGGPIVIVQPGQQFSQTSSGYPIFTGGRAIDSTAPTVVQQQGSGPIIIQTQNQEQLAPQPIGRNGLLANPCVDPASVHGLAYSRHYN